MTTKLSPAKANCLRIKGNIMDIKGLLGKVLSTFVRKAVDSGVKAGEEYLNDGKPARRKAAATSVRATAKKARKAARVTRKISR